MSYDPYKIIPAVLIAAIKDDRVLLARRRETSYMDGWYGLPGGHLEANETLQEGAVRELREETDLVAKPEDLELFHVYQNINTPGRQYIGFMFRLAKWQGRHKDNESKVEGAKFFDLSSLPDKLIPYHKEALNKIDGPAIEITFVPLSSFNPSGK